MSNSKKVVPENRIYLLKDEGLFARELDERIKLGEEIIESKVDLFEFDLFEDRIAIWNDYNKDLLRGAFNNDIIYKEYISAGLTKHIVNADASTADKYQYRLEKMKKLNNELKSIKGRLNLYIDNDKHINDSDVDISEKSTQMPSSVFIVHGHDESVKEKIARFLEKLNIKPIILHEQPNRGYTVIEKLEAYSNNIDFVIVLLTPDDVGKKAGEIVTLPRARQNVIAELGYFIGKLGRRKVCSIYVENVEIPSDFNGVLYIPYDKAGGWKLQLANELRDIGFNIDMNKILVS